MIPVPPKLEWGPRKLRDWLEILRIFCIKSRLVNVMGGTLDETDNGQVLGVDNLSGSSASFPFKLIDASMDRVKKVRVVYGTLAGKAPDGMSQGDDPHYILTVTGACVIYGGVSVDESGNVTSRYIDSDDSTPLNDDTNAYIEIGSVSINSGKMVIAQALTWSPDLMACRRWFEAGVKFSFTWL